MQVFRPGVTLPRPLRQLRWSFSLRWYSAQAQVLAEATSTKAPVKDAVPLQDTKNYIYAACILQRNPITTTKLSDFEQAYENYQLSLMQDNSRTVFDIKTSHKLEMARIAEEKEKTKGSAPDASSPSHQPISDETLSLIRSSDYTHAPEYINAEDDLKSLHRKLDRKLYLVVKNERDLWQFPSVHIKNANKSLRERLDVYMWRLVGEEAELFEVGNSPVAYYYQALPERTTAPLALKTFFLKSQLIRGKPRIQSTIRATDHAWLVKEELADLLPTAYFEAVKAALQY